VKIKWTTALTAVLVLSLAGCGPAPRAAGNASDEAELVIGRAKADLAECLGVGMDEITMVSISQTQIPEDAEHLCEPKPVHGNQATPIYVVRLMVWPATFVYYGNERCVMFVPHRCDSLGGCIKIASVRVTADAIVIAGSSTLAAGTSIVTELLADGSSLSWWPANACTTVGEGGWQIIVPLGKAGAPARLDPIPQYTVRAWYADHPSIEAVPFWFDLVGPAMPAPTPG
jgi:hypothetical protein